MSAEIAKVRPLAECADSRCTAGPHGGPWLLLAATADGPGLSAVRQAAREHGRETGHVTRVVTSQVLTLYPEGAQ